MEYSSREDYFQFLLGEGVVASFEDLVSNDELVLLIQQHWQRNGQIGCKFAHYMAKDPLKHAWFRIVVSGEDPESWPIEEVGQNIADAIADENIWAVSVIFPQVESEKQLVQLVRMISELPDWTVTPLPDTEQQVAGLVLLAIRRRLSESPTWSWPLMFGPFDFFPLTRQAPFMEITLVTQPKREPLRPQLAPHNFEQAHLADVPLMLPDNSFSRMLRQTERFKSVVLDGKDARARAKVSVPIPSTLWEGEFG